MNILLDTNAVSETFKPHPNPGFLAEFDRLNPDDLCLSVISLGELRIGTLRMPPSRRQQELDAWLATLEQNFSGRILPVDIETSHLWAEVETRRTRLGRPISITDALIAATALRHNLTLLTRNTPDFEHTGVKVINPWT